MPAEADTRARRRLEGLQFIEISVDSSDDVPLTSVHTRRVLQFDRPRVNEAFRGGDVAVQEASVAHGRCREGFVGVGGHVCQRRHRRESMRGEGRGTRRLVLEGFV